jgi:maltose alpha-D-glucosyltransferase / alpha-amylase
MASGRYDNPPPTTPSASDAATAWHLDAIFYEFSVRSFYDGNHDGIGDFLGLTSKLDYLHELGVTCLWLMPFYPSPWRDDGFDISDYRAVHPALGTMNDVAAFLSEAHRRGLRVVADLVANHTSSEHPWFQAARSAPAGSSLRNFYVWSDSPRRLEATRAQGRRHGQQSGWTWDSAADAYYWHRFSEHQPDLNYDHPPVIEEMAKVVRFWFEAGFDGISLSGAPFLIEREQTSGEGLPETHAALRAIRQAIGDRGGVLVAGANAWPNEAQRYFGGGDQCQLVPHLPLAQRLFLALRQEDRYGLQNILEATPSIPAGCQWITLLRNHDELTLGLATDEEQDYMYREYAADPQMRCQAGIVRRLAPLLENSRSKLDLMFSLLFALPGAPLIYYGDEIGMGDNIYLGQRRGVRTPMQWSADRNAGFSLADFARLTAPPVMDPVFGYRAANVDAQRRDGSSLLHAVRRFIGLRKRLQSLSRGSLTWIDAENRRIAAFVRSHGDERLLIVANLAASLQGVSLDLSAYEGLTPVDVFGRSMLPPIARDPYFLTLAPHAFYWLSLQRKPSDVAARLAPVDVEEVERLPRIDLQGDMSTLWNGQARETLERSVLPAYLRSQRWFGSKGQRISSLRIAECLPMPCQACQAFLVLVEVSYEGGKSHLYFLPMAISQGARGREALDRGRRFAIAELTGIGEGALLHDLLASDEACRALLESVQRGEEFPASQGRIVARPTTAFERLRGDASQELPIVRAAATSSNSLVLYGRRLLMKLFRRLEPGINPDVEIGRYFTEQHEFRPTPKLGGTIQYERHNAPPLTLAIFQALVANQGDGWEHVIDELGRFYQRAAGRMRGPDRATPDPRTVMQLVAADPPPMVLETIGGYLHAASLLGQRTAEMHLALAAGTDVESFGPAPLAPHDFAYLIADIAEQGETALRLVEANFSRLPEALRADAERFQQQAPQRLARLQNEAPLGLASQKIRCHGDYHLGQVLRVENDFVILDFEGEPTRSVEERRSRQSPLKDIAGMLRSYHYAAYAGLFAFAQNHPADRELLEPWAELWHQWVSAAFLRAYLATIGSSPLLPSDRWELSALLDLFVLDKALYELAYELNNRPDWVGIPLRGILQILGGASDSADSAAGRSPSN